MSYKTNKTTKKRIDSFLTKNAEYQAARYCRVNFINPIKDIDLEFYNRIILA